MKRLCLIGACLIAWNAHAQSNEVRIGVLGLFHPKTITITPVAGRPLVCSAARDNFSVRDQLALELAEAKVKIHGGSQTPAAAVHCDDGQGNATEIAVSVPQKLERHYQGKIDIVPQSRELLVILTMDLEVAVASIVAAESSPQAPLEALKAQAVASRSFLVSGKGRHRSFDFCDTTHCQFLRQPPAPETLAFQAVVATRGLVLAYKGEPFVTLYSKSCGGRTHSLEELGIPVHGYPYFAVECSYCLRHPEKWVAQISESDAATLASTESSRLKLARRLGWKTIPGNSYSTHAQNGSVLVEGAGMGHGIGLCQRGAADMALRGASFQEILQHYYPNTELKQR